MLNDDGVIALFRRGPAYCLYYGCLLIQIFVVVVFSKQMDFHNTTFVSRLLGDWIMDYRICQSVVSLSGDNGDRQVNMVSSRKCFNRRCQL